jgi:hypothetical protein
MADPSFVDILWDQLNSAAAFRAERRFARFVRQRAVTKWVIATDFCIGDPNRPYDSFAFVVFPAGEQLDETVNRLSRIPPRDLKAVRRRPSSKIIRILRKGKVFSFCFVADKSRRVFADAQAARQGIDETIKLMEAWENADECRDVIDRIRAMRYEAQKDSVSTRLLADIIVCAALAAYISALLCKHGAAERIGWAPDRDKITNAYSGIAATLYGANVSALAERMQLRNPVVNMFAQSNENLWCDPYIRLADFIAGAAAAWNPEKQKPVSQKIADVILAFADNRYLSFFRVEIGRTPDETTEVRVVQLILSRKELASSQRMMLPIARKRSAC